MVSSDRFIWKKGDVVLSKSDKPLTKEEKQRAKKRLKEIMGEFDDTKASD
jgi:hypothetical protein